jgi:hypothetical protein
MENELEVFFSWIPRIKIDESEKPFVRKIDQFITETFRTAQYLLVAATFSFLSTKTDLALIHYVAVGLKILFGVHFTNGISVLSIIIFPKRSRFFEIANWFVSLLIAISLGLLMVSETSSAIEELARQMSK